MNQFCNEEIQIAVEKTETRYTYVMAHAHTSEATIRCLMNGVRSIEHATAIDRATTDAVVSHNAYAAPVPGLPQVMLDKMEEASQYALESLQHLHRAGTGIGFGTYVSGTRMPAMQSKEFMLRCEILTPLEILRPATFINADLLVIEGNPLNDIALLEQHDKLVLSRQARLFRGNLSEHNSS